MFYGQELSLALSQLARVGRPYVAVDHYHLGFPKSRAVLAVSCLVRSCTIRTHDQGSPLRSWADRPVLRLQRDPLLGLFLGRKVPNMRVWSVPGYYGYEPAPTLRHFRFKMRKLLHRQIHPCRAPGERGDPDCPECGALRADSCRSTSGSAGSRSKERKSSHSCSCQQGDRSVGELTKRPTSPWRTTNALGLSRARPLVHRREP